ncbi:hypothetical protein X747_29130 [Mesorhizobium sp. LNJC384A00]|nr:hypothetical protein X747_29130 [Mesorhizobium sp. LNJC384A00]
MSRADLQIFLRREPLMLRNVAGVSLEPATEDALNAIAAEMKVGRSDLIQIVLCEWLETNAYLPVPSRRRAKPTGSHISDDAVVIRLSKRRAGPSLISAPATVGALRKTAYKPQSCARPQR